MKNKISSNYKKLLDLYGITNIPNLYILLDSADDVMERAKSNLYSSHSVYDSSMDKLEDIIRKYSFITHKL
ncbi:MAG: hypothetical protein LBT10_06425 [Methanobrevibacter sp.]|nr:hypothetical protein [Methanobrevibacter sp.]